jgi:hypothetical protein
MSHPSLKRLDYHQEPKGNFLRHRSNRGLFPARSRPEMPSQSALCTQLPRTGHPALCAAAHTFMRPENMRGHMPVLAADGRQPLMIGGDFDRDRAVLTRKALLDQLAGDNPPRSGFTWPGLGVVERTGNAYRFIPL